MSLQGFQTATFTSPNSLPIQPNPLDTVAEFEVTGTYTGLTIVIEESIDSQASWIPRAALDLDNRQIVSTRNGLSVSNNQTHGWKVEINSVGTTQIRLRVSAIGSGSVTVNAKTFQGDNPFDGIVATASSGGPGSFSTMALTGLLTEMFADSLTAHAGGGQGSGTAITAQMNTFTTVASTGDSGTLVASAAGLDIVVVNAGANSMNIFPAGTDQIGVLGASNACSLAAGRTLRFTCTASGQWHTTASAPPQVNTAISTAGAGTLTAAGLVGGLITRTGPTAAYTDTTDTAANIIAAIPGAEVGTAFEVWIKNTVAFNETLAGGASVTLSGQTIIPPNSVGRFLVTVATSSTVTMRGIAIAPLTLQPLMTQTTLATNGAGTITAAGIVGGVTLRTTVASNQTDTTDTAANIIAALPNGNAGQSWEWTYLNNTGVTMTLAGGSSVTITGQTIVGPGCWATFLVTMATATTVTMTTISAGQNYGGLPLTQLSTGTTTTTFTAGQLTGAQDVTYTSTAATPGSIATRTATQMFGDVTGAFVGMTWRLRIWNNSGSANSLTVTAGTGVTLSGKTSYIITQFGFLDFYCQFTSTTTMTMQAIGAGVGTTN